MTNKIRQIIQEALKQNEADELDRLRSDKFQKINAILEHDLPLAIQAELDSMDVPAEKRKFVEQLKTIDMQLNVSGSIMPGGRQQAVLKIKIY